MSKKKVRQKRKAQDPLKRLKALFRQQTPRDLLWYYQAGECVERLHPHSGGRHYGDSRMQALAKDLNQPGGKVNSLATLLRYYRQFYNAYARPEVADLCNANPDNGFRLSWTHVLKLSSVKKSIRKRLQEQCIRNRWPTDKLQDVIEAKCGGKKSKGGRQLAPPKSHTDTLRQMIRMSDNWLRRFDEVWFGETSTLHASEPKPREYARLRELVQSAEKMLAKISQKTKAGQQHLKRLKANVEGQ